MAPASLAGDARVRAPRPRQAASRARRRRRADHRRCAAARGEGAWLSRLGRARGVRRVHHGGRRDNGAAGARRTRRPDTGRAAVIDLACLACRPRRARAGGISGPRWGRAVDRRHAARPPSGRAPGTPGRGGIEGCDRRGRARARGAHRTAAPRPRWHGDHGRRTGGPAHPASPGVALPAGHARDRRGHGRPEGLRAVAVGQPGWHRRGRRSRQGAGRQAAPAHLLQRSRADRRGHGRVARLAEARDMARRRRVDGAAQLPGGAELPAPARAVHRSRPRAAPGPRRPVRTQPRRAGARDHCRGHRGDR